MKTKLKLNLWAGAFALGALLPAAETVSLEPAELPLCCQPVRGIEPAALPPESIYQLDFAFQDDAGAVRQLAELRGQPTMVVMFFAQCSYACPLLVQDMRKIREGLSPEQHDQFRMLMVTFDTDRDTVEALHAYRDRMALDEQWELWRAGAADIRTLAMVLGVQFRREPNGDYSHSNLITLLDADGVLAHRRRGLEGGIPAASEAMVRLIARSPGK